MKKIGVIVNTKRPRAEGILSEFRRLAASHGFVLFAESKTMADTLDAEYLPIKEFADEVDVVVAMGGDGTMLYAARALEGSGIPIMGINLGSLGFLTGVSDQEISVALNALKTGEFQVSEREMATCRVIKDGVVKGEEPALNDIVLGWGASSRIVTLELSIGDRSVGTFMCDGMIISTPTGSTGHSLSSGGPILHPEICGFGINVICPHTLSSRPLVVPSSCQITVEVANAAKELILSIDGQDNHRVAKGDRIEIVKNPHPALFLQLPEHDYFSILAQKLHWRGSSLH